MTFTRVASTITRRQHGGHLPRAQAGAMLGHFRRHLARRDRVLEPTPALFDDAMRPPRQHRHRAYDAVQRAAALDLHRRHRDAALGPVTLVSADQALSDAATVEGLTVDDPRSHP